MTGDVVFDAVRKVYRWRGRRRGHETLKGTLFRGRRRNARRTHEHVAIDRLDLVVRRGEAVAVIGPNGSGKSTMLKLASGILQPSSGKVVVDGRVTALIELGAGFHPEISGRENVVINGMLLGLSRSEIESRMAEIIDFAAIGGFVDEPVKTYSSGMYVRLGFAVAVAAEPDVLLIDEVLSVGDEAFMRRSLDRLAWLRRRGVTMILVTHDLELASRFADRAVYLRAGAQEATGAADTVVARYRSDVAGDPSAADGADRVRVQDEGRRWGTGDVEITAVEVVSGGTAMRLLPSAADCTISISYKVHQPVDDFVFGIAWRAADGSLVAGHNTHLDGLVPRRLGVDGTVRCHYPALHLAPGKYLLDVAVHARGGLAYDYRCAVSRLEITSAIPWPGVWAPSHAWSGAGPEWE